MSDWICQSISKALHENCLWLWFHKVGIIKASWRNNMCFLLASKWATVSKWKILQLLLAKLNKAAAEQKLHCWSVLCHQKVVKPMCSWCLFLWAVVGALSSIQYQCRLPGSSTGRCRALVCVKSWESQQCLLAPGHPPTTSETPLWRARLSL